MATQLQFSRHAPDGRDSLRGSDVSPLAWEASHRHVAFAVHDAVPSPQLYHHQHQPQRFDRQSINKKPNAFDTMDSNVWEVPIDETDRRQLRQPMKTVPARTMRGAPVDRSKATAATKNATAKTAKSNAPRQKPARPVTKPGWEIGAASSSNLFDTTLKKSVLFQPRPGDRLREVNQEEQRTRSAVGAPPPTRKSSSAWNARIATTLPAQPKRKPRDYVKSNMEKITGQRYETLVRRNQATAAPTRQSRSVFERLSAPVLRASLLRFRSPSPTRVQTQASEVDDRRHVSVSSPMKLMTASPVISSYPAQEAQPSPSRGRLSESRPSVSKRSSSSRERASPPSSTRRSTPSRASSPGFRSERGDDDDRGQHSIMERVFEILDRERRGRIGVEQIVEGLRLLQLPATHNQVADYVYLIHEGAVSTIDYEEWAILVGTLDAASGPAGTTSRTPSVRSRTSPPSNRDYSPPPRSKSSFRNSPPRSLNHAPSPPKSVPYELHQDSHVPTTAWPRESDDEDARVKTHKNRTYPQEQSSTSLTVKMPESKLTKLAKHSDDLADLLLDDLLLDTVEELNKQERRQSERNRQYLHVETLESILQQINDIEAAEAELINSGFALGYKIDGPENVPAVSPLEQTMETAVNQNLGNLVLPLGVVMSADHDGNDLDHDNLGRVPVEPTPHRAHLEPFDSREVLAENGPTEYRVENPAASMALLSGRKFQSIEKSRVQFLKHRQLVESSLESTGMDQASVIEMLADLMLDEIALECAVELESGVEDLTETLAHTLL